MKRIKIRKRRPTSNPRSDTRQSPRPSREDVMSRVILDLDESGSSTKRHGRNSLEIDLSRGIRRELHGEDIDHRIADETLKLRVGESGRGYVVEIQRAGAGAILRLRQSDGRHFLIDCSTGLCIRSANLNLGSVRDCYVQVTNEGKGQFSVAILIAA